VKRLLVCLLLALALAVPAQASARQREYDGTITPSAELGFKLKFKKGEKPKVKGFTFSDVPITCGGVPNTTFGKITGGLKVRKKRFGAQLVNDAGTSNLHVAGTVSKSGSIGTIRVFGDGVPLQDPPTDPPVTGTDCETGVLDWTASRA
jgi:hypothetical protein